MAKETEKMANRLIQWNLIWDDYVTDRLLDKDTDWPTGGHDPIKAIVVFVANEIEKERKLIIEKNGKKSKKKSW